jgi:hypothetical protein
MGLVYDRYIRRIAASAEPAEAASPEVADQTPPTGPVEARRKRKKRRSPGGLGRGLARILVDSQDPADDVEARSGLLQLVGGQSPARLREIRRLVADRAVVAVADGFGLDGLVLVAALQPPLPAMGVANPAEPPVVASIERLAVDESTRQRLIRCGLDGPAGIPTPLEGGRWWSLHLPGSPEGAGLSAVAIRSQRFDPAEVDALASVVNSVAEACDEDPGAGAFRQRIVDGTTVVLNDGDGADEIRAEVRADWPSNLAVEARTGPRRPALDRRTGLGHGPDATTAVARAAAKACRPRCKVAFAGSSIREGVEVTIVIVHNDACGLRLGIAVTAPGDPAGAAEAVFTATSDGGSTSTSRRGMARETEVG